MNKMNLLNAIILVLLVIYGCSEDDSETSITTPPSTVNIEISEYIEFIESEEGMQRSVFFYDDNDNIVRYEFSQSLIDGGFFTSIFFTYEYDDNDVLTSSQQSVFDFITEAFVVIQEREYLYNNIGLLSEIRERIPGENTGGILVITRNFFYNEDNRLSRIDVDGFTQEQYLYNADGNLIERIGGETDLGSFVTGFSFTDSRNPFFGLPLLFGNRFIVAEGFSTLDEFLPERITNHINSVDTTPTNTIDFEYEFDDNERLVRRRMTVTNTAFNEDFSVITEIQYRN